MDRILKFAGAAALTSALAVAAATPGNARDWHGRGAAAAGFAAGAVVGAAAASSYNNGYYYGGPGYYGDYAYEPGYVYEPGPTYYNDYAYEGPGYRVPAIRTAREPAAFSHRRRSTTRPVTSAAGWAIGEGGLCEARPLLCAG